MERGNLTFIDTFTVEQFKERMGVEQIVVRKSPKTNNLFFTYGGKAGAVALKGIPKHPMISYVKGDPTPENPSGEFYLLHEECGAPVIASF